MKRLEVAIATISLTLLAACAGRSARSTSFEGADSRQQELTVEVENQNYYGATIHAYRAGGRRRLGFVEAYQTGSFSFDWPNADLRFLIDFLAAGCIITESLSVGSGDDLLLVLQSSDNQRARQEVCRRL
jgi:outer membrane biogenesis lipoprotein LolB